MSMVERLVALPPRERRGSRARCLLLTDGSPSEVATRLTRLVAPWGVVDPTRHFWLPRGFDAPAEAKLGETAGLLSPVQRQAVTDWWLEVIKGANTPNWDIASTATIGGREGLLLVEAKAHDSEIKTDGKQKGDAQNEVQIRSALAGASQALNAVLPGWSLSADSHYQLANRFAWAWKIASLGVPLVLVYLGFLHATEMFDRGRPLETADQWELVVRTHARGIVPDTAWSETLMIGTTPLRAAIRSMRLDLPHSLGP